MKTCFMGMHAVLTKYQNSQQHTFKPLLVFKMFKYMGTQKVQSASLKIYSEAIVYKVFSGIGITKRNAILL